MTRSNSVDCVASGWDAAADAGAAAPSRGKKASVVAAPAQNNTAIITAIGLPTRTRRSRAARRGKVVMGNEVAAPDMTNSPTTAAYVIRHSRQYVFRMNIDAYAR